MKLTQYFTPSVIGLDIQPDAARILHLKQGLIDHAASIALPPEIFQEGKIKNWSLLTESLKDLTEPLRTERACIAISLPTQLVNMQHLQLPRGLLNCDIETEIYAHMQKQLPYVKENLTIDFVETEKKQTENQVFYAATRQEYIHHYTMCIKQLGLRIKIIDIDILALQRAIFYAARLSILSGETYAMLRIYKNKACLFIFTSQEIMVNQQWQINNLAHFAEQLKQYLQVLAVNIQRLIIWGEIKYANTCNEIMSNNKQDTLIYHVDSGSLLARFRLAPHLDQAFLKPNLDDYLLSFGLAMREAPKW